MSTGYQVARRALDNREIARELIPDADEWIGLIVTCQRCRVVVTVYGQKIKQLEPILREWSLHEDEYDLCPGCR